MTESTPETPAEDRLEQEPLASDAAPSSDPEAPEADAVEQATVAAPQDGSGATGGGPFDSAEAAEADLAEQSLEVGLDDDERR
jgi:hypothetical protein